MQCNINKTVTYNVFATKKGLCDRRTFEEYLTRENRQRDGMRLVQKQ
jgi:hypothetical protein